MKETVLPEATLQILLENNTVNKFVDALEMDSSGSIEVVMEKDSTLDRRFEGENKRNMRSTSSI